MRYSNLRTLFYNMIGDSESSPVFFSETTVEQLANSALSELYAETDLIYNIKLISCVSGTGEYDLPADCYDVKRVAYDGRRLRPITQARLDSDDATWVEHNGEPEFYYVDGLDKQIGVYPIPDVDSELVTGGEYGVYTGGGDTEYGVYITSSGLEDEHGVYVGGFPGKYLQVDYSAVPETFDKNKKPQIPLWGYYYLLWRMMSEAYLIGLPDADMEASVAYSVLAGQAKQRIITRAANPLNKVWRKRAGRLANADTDVRLRWGELS